MSKSEKNNEQQSTGSKNKPEKTAVSVNDLLLQNYNPTDVGGSIIIHNVTKASIQGAVLGDDLPDGGYLTEYPLVDGVTYLMLPLNKMWNTQILDIPYGINGYVLEKQNGEKETPKEQPIDDDKDDSEPIIDQN